MALFFFVLSYGVLLQKNSGGARMTRLLSRRWRFKGLGLLEIGLGLGLLGVFLAGSSRENSNQVQDAKANSAADHIAQTAAASKEYMRAYRSQLLAATTVGGSALGISVGRRSWSGVIPSGPSEAPGLPSVQGGGFLPSSYVDRNPYQAHHILYVRQPVAGTLEGIVSARWGQDVPDRALARIMSRLGAPGGAVLNRPASGDLSKLQGTGGAWEISAADRSLWAYNSGTYIESRRPVYNLAMSDQGTIKDYLYRNDIGIPEANTMRTALIMGNNDINAVARLNANQTILQNGGNTCAGDATGCTFWISNEGGFRDNNNGWIQFIGNFGDNSAPDLERGLYIGGGARNHLFVDGNSRVRGNLAIAGATYLYTDANIGRNLSVYRTSTFGNRLGVMASPDDLPGGWGGGVRTIDIVASGNVVAGFNHHTVGPGNVTAYLSREGDVGATRDGTFGRNVRVGARIGTNGYDPNELPVGWGGGVRTADVVASGGVYVWDDGFVGPIAGMDRWGRNFGRLRTTNYASAGAACPLDASIGRDVTTGSPLWCRGGFWEDLNSISHMGRITSVNAWNVTCDPGYYVENFKSEMNSAENSYSFQCVKIGY
jgi:hypothetical protein